MLTQIFVVALLQLFVAVQSNVLTQLAANSTGAPAADAGDSIPGVRDLCTSVGMTLLFCVLTVFALMLAKGISGGVGIALPRVSIAGFGRSLVSGGGSSRAVAGATGAPGASGASGPGGIPGGAGTAGLPPRQYAFNRTVGSAL